jgi:hypothetical protein
MRKRSSMHHHSTVRTHCDAYRRLHLNIMVQRAQQSRVLVALLGRGEGCHAAVEFSNSIMILRRCGVIQLLSSRMHAGLRCQKAQASLVSQTYVSASATLAPEPVKVKCGQRLHHEHVRCNVQMADKVVQQRTLT